MLDTRGDPVRLLLEGGDDDLFLARNALGRGRTRTALDTGEASTLGGKRIRLEQLNGIHLYQKETAYFDGLPYLSFKGISLPSGLRGNQFNHAYSVARRPLKAPMELYSHKAVSFGKWLYPASRCDNAGEIVDERSRAMLWRVKDMAKAQNLAPIYNSRNASILPFIYRDGYAIVSDAGASSATLSRYDWNHQLLGSAPFNWPNGPDVYRAVLMQGNQGRFYVMTVLKDGGFDRPGSVELQARMTDAPDVSLWTATFALDVSDFTDRVIFAEYPCAIYEYNGWVFCGWQKRKWTDANHQTALGDWFILDRASGALVSTRWDQPYIDLTIDPKAGCFTISKHTITFTRSSYPSGPITLAQFSYRIDQRDFSAAPPVLTVQRTLGTAQTIINGTDLPAWIDDDSFRLTQVYE